MQDTEYSMKNGPFFTLCICLVHPGCVFNSLLALRGANDDTARAARELTNFRRNLSIQTEGDPEDFTSSQAVLRASTPLSSPEMAKGACATHQHVG